SGAVRSARLHPERQPDCRGAAGRFEERPARPDLRDRSARRSVRGPAAPQRPRRARGRVSLRPAAADRGHTGRPRHRRDARAHAGSVADDRADARGCVRVAGAAQGRVDREGGVMRRLLALTRKELLQLSRDSLTMRMIVAVPLLQLLIFGYAINYDVKHLKTVVMDESRSFESRELVAKMKASDYFDLIGRLDSFHEL